MDIKPKFVYNEDYYFDIDSNTIYGEEKHTFLYFHELSHFNDYKHKIHKDISKSLEKYDQIMKMVMFLCFLISLLTSTKLDNWIYIWFLFYMPVFMFVTYEEVKAYIRGFIYWRRFKWKNTL